jgi:hypothetical protein
VTTTEDNNPPEDPFTARLSEQHQDFLDEQVGLLLAKTKLPREVNSDDDVAAIAAWELKARALARKAEATRVEATKPWLEMQRKTKTFFDGIGAALLRQADEVKARSGPYLRAKKEREEAAARARAEEARRQERIAEEKRHAAEQAAAEAQARADKAAADLRKAEHDAARHAGDEVGEHAAFEADDAQTRLQEAARDLQSAEDAGRIAMVQGDQAAQAAGEAALAAQGGFALAKTGVAGANVGLKEVWSARVEDAPALRASLGPLAPFLSQGAVLDAVARAGRSHDRPPIPGVVYDVTEEVQTSARRG